MNEELVRDAGSQLELILGTLGILGTNSLLLAETVGHHVAAVMRDANRITDGKPPCMAKAWAELVTLSLLIQGPK